MCRTPFWGSGLGLGHWCLELGVGCGDYASGPGEFLGATWELGISLRII